MQKLQRFGGFYLPGWTVGYAYENYEIPAESQGGCLHGHEVCRIADDVCGPTRRLIAEQCSPAFGKGGRQPGDAIAHFLQFVGNVGPTNLLALASPFAKQEGHHFNGGFYPKCRSVTGVLESDHNRNMPTWTADATDVTVGERACDTYVERYPRSIRAVGLTGWGRGCCGGIPLDNEMLVQMEGKEEQEANRSNESKPYPSNFVFREERTNSYRPEESTADQGKPDVEKLHFSARHDDSLWLALTGALQGLFAAFSAASPLAE